MAAEALGLPQASVSKDRLPVKTIDPAKFFRISKFDTGEPYFGASGGNRFDAPGCKIGAPEYSACYFGFALQVAIAESILHDEMPSGGKFPIARSVLDAQFVHRYTGSNLTLADLTGASLKWLGGHADLAGTGNYAITQQWALALYQNPKNVDGFIYMSRHLNTKKAVILFDRASAKIQSLSCTPLLDVPAFGSAAKALRIVGV